MNAVVQDSATRRIVVGVDGSECSKRALRWGAYLARVSDAKLEAVMVWEPIPPSGYGWNFAGATTVQHDDIDKMLTATIDEVFGPERPPNLTLHALEGHPAGLLIGFCTGAAMLVVGSRGHGGFTNLLLGSVGAKCSEHAPCAVVVVHDTEPPEQG
jgi:nucleotide-binding universal stress UspA family protein